MATRAELPDLALLEREAELATLRVARGRGPRRGGRGRRDRGHGRDRQDAAARRGARQTARRPARAHRARRASTRATSPSASSGSSSSRCSRRRRPTQRAELFSGAAALAEPLFDATHLVTRAELEGDASFAMMHGLYWLAANLAFEQPTMLAIDDVHWADTPSLRWLCYLARRLEGLPLLVAVTTRPPEQGRDPELLTELLGDPATTRDPARAAQGRLDRARSSGGGSTRRPTTAFCAAVEAATRGNPLLVLALLDTVAREGVRAAAPTRRTCCSSSGRVVVGRAVSLRLARLPEDATALIEAAAILGDGTEPRPGRRARGARAGAGGEGGAHPAALGPADPGRPGRVLPPRRADGDLRRARHARAQRGPPARRRGCSSRPARCRSRRPRTCSRPSPGDDPFVVATLREAARRSLEPGRRRRRRRLPQARARGGADDAARAEVLVELGLAERLIDGPAAAEHLAAGLELLTDPRRRAEVALELGSVLFYVNRIPECMARARARARRDEPRRRCPSCHERLEAEFIASTWWVPETFPVAAARLEALDLDAAPRRLRQRPPARRRDVLRVPARRGSRARRWRSRGGRSSRASSSRAARSASSSPRSRSSARGSSTRRSPPTTPP